MKKITYRIPTTEYAYIEVEQEADSPTSEAIVEGFKELQKAYTGGAGLSKKDFDALLDTYLRDGVMSSELYDQCSPEQVNIVQAIKRSLNRIKYAGQTD